MTASSVFIHQLMASPQQGEGLADATVLAQSIRGREHHDYLYGGREMALPALLARVARSMGLPAAELAEQLVVVLGVREFEPTKVMWSPLLDLGISAINACEVMVDGDQFFLQEGGTLVAARCLSIRSLRPELAAQAWRVHESSWGLHGVLDIRWGLDLGSTPPVMAYDVAAPVARWRSPHFAAGFGSPCELGCEEFFLQVVLVASSSVHPLRGQLLSAGLLKEGQSALALIAVPNLGILATLSKGPAANNVLGSELDGPFSGSQSPYSAWSGVAAKQLLDEWGLANGTIHDLESLVGCTRMLMDALGGIMEGDLVAGGAAEKSYGLSVAEWIGGTFSRDAEVGAGLVRDIAAQRANGVPLSLEVRTEQGVTGLVVLHLDPHGSPERVERLF